MTVTFQAVTTAPIVTTPILTGATSVSGTSTEDDGTTINVIVDAISKGTTTVASGSWTKTGLTALTAGQVVSATATATDRCESTASNSVTVITPGPPTQIAINAGDSQSAPIGTPVSIAPSVIVKDASDIPVSGVSVTFAVATGGGSGTGLSATTNGSGIATVGSWTLGTTAGSNTLTATTGSLTPVTFNATGTAGTATKYLVSLSDYNPVAGTAVTISAQLADVYSNAVSTANKVVTWSKSDANGSFASGTSNTNSSGIATVSFTTHTVVGTTTSVTATDAESLSGTSSIVTTKAGSTTLNIKVFLEGPYAGAGAMNTTLNSSSLIPLAHPYSGAPWNVAAAPASSIPAGVVDWVLVELRDAATPAAALSGTTLAGWPRAYFLKSDGSIVDRDGTQPNIGSPTITGNLYVIVRHRNHLAIMSNTGATLNDGVYSYDFTTALTQAYGSGIGYKQIETGVYGMVAGDINNDGNVFVTDYNIWAVDFGLTHTYSNSDLTQDGNVFVTDYNEWAVNFGITTTNPSLLKSAQLKPRYFSCVPE